MLLIVDKSKRNGRSFKNSAYIMGFLAHYVTPYELFKETSPFYSAILMVEPDSFKEDREYFEKVEKYKLGMPIFALNSKKDNFRYSEYFNKIFYGASLSPKIISGILDYCKNNGYRSIGTYCGYGYQASFNYRKPYYFEDSLENVTRTEIMILRLLLRVHPQPMNAADIIKYAFRYGKQIELATIRTHISLLNKNCRCVTGKNAVELMPKSGYIINTPKLGEKARNYLSNL